MLAASSVPWAKRPRLLDIQPDNGPEGGGTHVQIKGQYLGTSSEDVQGIWIAKEPCVQWQWWNQSHLDCITAPHPGGGWGPVQMATRSGGSSSLENETLIFTYNYVPHVVSVEPRHGTVLGGTRVNITGKYLGESGDDVLWVRVATVPCILLEWDSSRQLVCTTAPAPQLRPRAGPVQVMTLTGGLGESGDTWSYQPTPLVESIWPSEGAAQSAHRLHLQGVWLADSLTDVVNVTVAGQPCVDVEFLHPGSLVCHVSPLQGVEEMQESVSGPVWVHSHIGGWGALVPDAPHAHFTFHPPPRIQRVSPASTGAFLATSILITGQRLAANMTDIVEIRLAGRACSEDVRFYGQRVISCRSPVLYDGAEGPVEVISATGGHGISDFTFHFFPECNAYFDRDVCRRNDCYWCDATTVCLSNNASCPARCLIHDQQRSCSQSVQCYWCPATTLCLEQADDCPPSCFLHQSEQSCLSPEGMNDGCRWCATTSKCISTYYVTGGLRTPLEFRCPSSCSPGQPQFTCGALILTLLLVLIMLILIGGWCAVIYFVRRDDRLAERLKRLALRMYSPIQQSAAGSVASDLNLPLLAESIRSSRNRKLKESQLLSPGKSVRKLTLTDGAFESVLDRDEFEEYVSASSSAASQVVRRSVAGRSTIGIASSTGRGSDAKYDVPMFQALIDETEAAE